ncbi:protein LBH isoform X2 [Paramormyrops kingsleyae]|nr:protein LBH-like isoform X2 [Paramormyrops kingsleyae]
MTQVMNTCEPGMADFSGGSTSEDQAMSFQVFPDSHDRYPKLSKRLPSIVVEPTEGGEVESGELRWPPDDLTPTEVPSESSALPPVHSQTTEEKLGLDSEDSLEMGTAIGGDSN